MTRVSVKKLARRCLLIVLLGLAAGCTSIKQMPSSPIPIEDRSNVTSTAIAQQAVASPVIIAVVKNEAEVSDKDLTLETPQKDVELIENIVSRFKLSVPVAVNIISLATENAYEDFPKKNDILAIIAVESSYNAKSLLRGCYGLMQIEKKSHKEKLAGRSLYNPAVNIELGSKILNQYYVLLGKNKRAAILAYNSGIGNYLKHRFKSIYYEKYRKQLEMLSKT
jgi:hypothetical protein